MSEVRYSEADGVATVTLDRPGAMNAFSLSMAAEFRAAVEQAARGVARCVLINAEGRAFCGGGDIAGSHIDAADFDAGMILEQSLNPAVALLAEMDKPLVTAVNGAAVGAGCALALLGDVVLAGRRSASFRQGFTAVGLAPDSGASWLLPRLIGRARANAMMLLNEVVSAETALDWGMVYELVEDDALQAAAAARARKLATGPTRAFAYARQAIRAGMDSSLSEALSLERALQQKAGRTADFREGVTAFREKRRPNFTGQGDGQ